MSDGKVDTSVAEAYESTLVPGLLRPWAEAIVARVGIVQGMRILDVACGTGIATRSAARLCGANGGAIGVDIDAGMIEIAKVTSMKEGVAAEFRIASASELPFESDTFDAALCLQGLQYFTDRPKAMAELHRVMKPGSKLVLATWTEIQNSKGHWALVTALERRNIDALPARRPFSLSDARTLRCLAENAGFKKVVVRREQRLAQFYSAKSFVDAVVQGAPSSRHALGKVLAADWPNFLAEVDDTLARWRQGAGLAFPMESNILEATR